LPSPVSVSKFRVGAALHQFSSAQIKCPSPGYKEGWETDYQLYSALIREDQALLLKAEESPNRRKRLDAQSMSIFQPIQLSPGSIL
jgi:hypothetical protein